jgi:hypothetical protein
VASADRTRRHPTSRPPDHRVPDLCDHPRSSAPGLLLLPRSSSLHAMPHLPPAHHETSKHNSPNEIKIKEKQKQNYPGFEFKPRQVNDSSQSNQGTDHLVSHRVIMSPPQDQGGIRCRPTMSIKTPHHGGFQCRNRTKGTLRPSPKNRRHRLSRTTSTPPGAATTTTKDSRRLSTEVLLDLPANQQNECMHQGGGGFDSHHDSSPSFRPHGW